MSLKEVKPLPMKQWQFNEESWGYEEESDVTLSPPRKFQPLDTYFSYMETKNPPALELVRTEDIGPTVPLTHFGKTDSMFGIPQKKDSAKIKLVTKSGKKITTKHVHYALTAGIILGIRECVGGDEALREAELDPLEILEGKELRKEWGRIRKYNFEAGAHSITSHYNSQPLPYAYEFKAYAPLVFARIRTAFGVEHQNFLHSICGKFNFVEFMSNAKSGQFFFFSHDGQYMIKTMTSEESIFLHEILPNYYRFLMENPHSFLTHFYGMYRVKMPKEGRSVHFCIMKSVFNTEREIHKTWDLKGSTKGRRAKRGDAVHKDLDILDEGRKLYVGPKVKEPIMEQLRRDATFLARAGIMDYSLLLGVHHRVDHEDDSQKHLKNSSPGTPTKSGHVRRPSMMRTNTPFRRQFLDELNLNVDESQDSGAEDELNLNVDESQDSGAEEDDLYDENGPNPFTSCQSFGEFGDEEESSNSHDQPSSESCASMQSKKYIRLDSNPYTTREDLGIESFSGDPTKKHTREIYFFGVIDILQQYNARKMGETVFRKMAGNAESEISCVDPETYANRFVKFMSALME